jgi:hypothetical protein
MNPPLTEAVLNPIIANVDIRRGDLRSDPTCRFVGWAEFCEMLISRSFFERSDDIEAAVLGLTNSSNGCRFLIEAEIIQKLSSMELN